MIANYRERSRDGADQFGSRLPRLSSLEDDAHVDRVCGALSLDAGWARVLSGELQGFGYYDAFAHQLAAHRVGCAPTRKAQQFTQTDACCVRLDLDTALN